MINAVVQNKDGKTAVIDLSAHSHEMYESLRSIGCNVSPEMGNMRTLAFSGNYVEEQIENDYSNGFEEEFCYGKELKDESETEDKGFSMRMEGKK